MKDNTLFYYTWNGQLRSLDLTFVNPFALLIDPIMRGVEKASRGDMSGAARATLGAIFSTYMDQQILAGAVMDASPWSNKDSTTGQPIYTESDGIGALWKGIKYVLKNAYAPRVLEKAWDMHEASQAPEVDEQYSASSIFMNEFWPAKPHIVDSQAQFTKLIARSGTAHSIAKARMNILKSRKPISDEDVRELARSVADERRAIDQRLFKAIRGFVSSKHGGLTINDAASIMREARYGPRKINLIFNAYTERSNISNDFGNDVVKLGDEGYRRLQIVADEYNKDTRYIKLDSK
jgi:hypothetical protein